MLWVVERIEDKANWVPIWDWPWFGNMCDFLKFAHPLPIRIFCYVRFNVTFLISMFFLFKYKLRENQYNCPDLCEDKILPQPFIQSWPSQHFYNVWWVVLYGRIPSYHPRKLVGIELWSPVLWGRAGREKETRQGKEGKTTGMLIFYIIHF